MRRLVVLFITFHVCKSVHLSVEDEGKRFYHDEEFSMNDSSFLGWFESLFKLKPKCYIKEVCYVSLPHNSKASCQHQRKADTVNARYWYQITDSSSPSSILFPLKHVIPWLNQTIKSIAYYYTTDPFEERYINLVGTWKWATINITFSMLKAYKSQDFFTYEEYSSASMMFEMAIKNLKRPDYFNAPVSDDEIATNNKWQDDDVFVQGFLSQQCPWSIRRVTENGDVGIKSCDIFAKTNPKFLTDLFDLELSKAYGRIISKNEAVKKGILYVLYHKEHDGIPSSPDILDRDVNDTRTMMNATSTITYFIRNTDGQLKVVAIQLDFTPDSPVYTPNSPQHKWFLAKAMASQSHQDVCQGYYHLGDAHFVEQVFCLSFRRHFSTLHPLYDVMKWHCEGTIPHITRAYATLLPPKSPGHQVFAVGNKGLLKLSLQAYQDRKYGKFDFDVWMQEQGIDEESFDYYPWRDDAKILWKEIQNFSAKVINLYYEDDEEVSKDFELQSFANEMSPDGKKGPDAGRGKYTGFPSRFTKKKDLKLFLTRFLWNNIFHISTNYPVHRSFMPFRAPKLYKDTQKSAAASFAHNLPDAQVTISTIFLFNALSFFRANRFMDYYDKVQDKRLKNLVYKTHFKLKQCVQKKLEDRNTVRKKKNQLGMKFLEPKWITNSVHI